MCKIKEIICIEKFDDTKVLIETDDKLPDDITFKNDVILMTCVIKDDDRFYPQLFLEEEWIRDSIVEWINRTQST